MAEPSFEDDLNALEKTIGQLESGKLTLDKAMRQFEQGVGLARRLRERLDSAEARIEQLLANGEVAALDVE